MNERNTSERPSHPSALDAINRTAELNQRPTRFPDFEKENRVLGLLMDEVGEASGADGVLQRIVESALVLCQAGSAGISVLERADGEMVFKWRAVAGEWARFLGGTMPRATSPCGTVIDQNHSLLFVHPERHFPIPPEVTPSIAEVLLIPFHVNGEAIGTVWVIAHDESRQFDREDERLILSLGRFASAACQTLERQEGLRAVGAESARSYEEARKRLLERSNRTSGKRESGSRDAQTLIADPRRLAILEATQLTHSGGEVFFDRLTRMAAELLDAPAAFLSLVDRDGDFYKSFFGFDEPLATTRRLSGETFCHHTLVSEGSLIVDDTLAHPLFQSVPTVHSLGVKAYLGILLSVQEQPLGAFCVIDHHPRRWTEQDIDTVAVLARAANAEIAIRAGATAAASADKERDAHSGGERSPAHDSLSRREHEVLSKILDGKRIKEIAFELDLSEKTVSTHRARILGKLELRDNRDLFIYAVRNGLV